MVTLSAVGICRPLNYFEKAVSLMFFKKAAALRILQKLLN